MYIIASEMSELLLEAIVPIYNVHCDMFGKYRTSANLFGNRIKMIVDEM